MEIEQKKMDTKKIPQFLSLKISVLNQITLIKKINLALMTMDMMLR